ncbi:MAG: hypothetical protein AAF333_14000 [Planctomycetota bacterium]
MTREWEQRASGGGVMEIESEPRESEAQINIPPTSAKGLWKVITTALRCPACGSTSHKAETGKRAKPDGLTEQYRRCAACSIRFRAIFE